MPGEPQDDHQSSGDDDDEDGRSEHPFRDAFSTVADAALEAEQLRTEEVESEEELRRAVFIRSARAVGGFMIIGAGIALLPLPGPGWVIIIIGLSMLPFAWAERTIRLIRRQIPGIPEDGRIPTSTWIIMGVIAVTATLLAMKFGGTVTDWLGEHWTNLWS